MSSSLQLRQLEYSTGTRVQSRIEGVSPRANKVVELSQAARSSQRHATADARREHVRGRALSFVDGAGKLSTFRGVFLPVSLNIIGIVLFLRLGWGIAQTGWVGVMLIFAAGAIHLALTESSMFALATDAGDAVGPLKAGGVYFVISRALGVDVGVSAGILLVFARAVSSAFYFSALAEEVFESYYDAERRTTQAKERASCLLYLAYVSFAPLSSAWEALNIFPVQMLAFFCVCASIVVGVYGTLFSRR